MDISLSTAHTQDRGKLTPPMLSSGSKIAPSPPIRVLTQPVTHQYLHPLVVPDSLLTWIHAYNLDAPILELFTLVDSQHVHCSFRDRVCGAFWSVITA